MPNLFDPAVEELKKSAPLADRVRPRELSEIVGQDHIIGPGTMLRTAIEKDELPSIVLWGPPGTGKTTLARAIAKATKSKFVAFSAVLSGVKEIRGIVAEAKEILRYEQRKTILFVDEIHRFNKSQQDAFLPYVEDGTIVLIGATTENPSFEINAALLSRMRVLVLERLRDEDIRKIARRALEHPNGLASRVALLEADALEAIGQFSRGDARTCLNILEISAAITDESEDGKRHIDVKTLEQAAQRKTLLYDKAGEEHYNVISALHKSIRGSDPDAALYWLYRMLDAGDDPLFVARRLIRAASEDIGNADPQALPLCIAAKESYHFLGTPEGELALAQAAVYLATAPKSNAVYVAEAAVRQDIDAHGPLPVPKHIRNAPTRLMKNLGYGKGYAYDHDSDNAFSGQKHLPDELADQRYYHPKPWGFEREIQKRMEYWKKKKQGEKKENPD